MSRVVALSCSLSLACVGMVVVHGANQQTAPTAPATNNYALGPDSQVQPGVPQGKVTQHSWTSRIYPGTIRDYWVYVPAQYDAETPACVMAFQDGAGYAKPDGAWRVPVVFDNLIHKKEMPVTIGSGGRAMLTVAVIPTQAAEAHVADVLHLGLTAQVSCGDTTLLVGPVGATFRCEVVEGDRPGRAYELEVTSLDGDVRYRAVPFGVAAG